MPDYFFCPVDNMFNCTEMKTILISDVVNMFSLVPPRILPDHSILSGKFATSFYDYGKNYERIDTTIGISKLVYRKKTSKQRISQKDCGISSGK